MKTYVVTILWENGELSNEVVQAPNKAAAESKAIGTNKYGVRTVISSRVG